MPAGLSQWCLEQKDLVVLALLLECGAQDVAERCAGVGRTELSHGFLLFGDFERLE